MNRLNPITAAIIGGIALAVFVVGIVPGSGFNELSLARWIHILSGVMWVGLLFYSNVAQIPGLAAAARKTTLYATRTNLVLSMPLVLCMGSATHGLPF